jgi:hypothetical protein
MLRSIGRTPLSLTAGRGDGAHYNGGPDPRDPSFPKEEPWPHHLSGQTESRRKFCPSAAMISTRAGPSHCRPVPPALRWHCRQGQAKSAPPCVSCSSTCVTN